MPRIKRTTNIDVEFDANGWAIGWHFKLHQAFKPALDIQYTPRKDKITDKINYEWTQGQPPAYEFTIGDVVHTDGVTVQIQQSTAAPDEDNDGATLLVRFFRSGRPSVDLRMSQEAFVAMLRSGHINGKPLADALS